MDANGEPQSLDILSTVGRVMQGVQVVIRDEQFQPVPQGQPGLITVLTPVRFEGYWLDPEKTSDTLRDGWVVMGDMGYFDAAGYLHLMCRNADQVQRNGMLLNPREIEEAAHGHPAVKEACLAQHGPQAVLVASVRRSWRGTSDWNVLANEIAELLARQLPPEKRPDDVRMVEETPRSFLNKMLRREVRQMLAQTSAPASTTSTSASHTAPANAAAAHP